MSEENPPDTSPPDISSAAAIDGPSRHPVTQVRAREGTAPTGQPREPDTFMAAILEGFPDAQLEDSHGQEVVRIDRSQLLEFARAAQQAGFEMCADVTAVDWFRHRRVRFEVAINLLSLQHKRRLRIVVPVPADEPSVPSLVDVWPGANYAERETYDMYGIVFEGHPDLTRILMPDDWEGYPLRKDFGGGTVPVQFKASHHVT